jgi:hypothetical protein
VGLSENAAHAITANNSYENSGNFKLINTYDIHVEATSRINSGITRCLSVHKLLRSSMCHTLNIETGLHSVVKLPAVALGPTQPSIQWVSEALSLGVMWQGREPDHSLPLVPRSRMLGGILPLSNTPSQCGA